MGKAKILVVEDEVILAMSIRQTLQGLGYDVLESTALGEQAVELAGKLRPDLALMDIHLAGKMDGIEAARRIREQFDIPVVYVTAFADEATLQAAQGANAYGYVVKPFRADTLQSAIETSLNVHRIESQLRESEAGYRLLFQTMPQGVLYVAPGGQILSANPAAERILGLSADQLKDTTPFDPCWRAIHPDGSDYPGESHPSMLALQTGLEQRDALVGVINPQQGQTRWLNINARPLFKPGEDQPFQVYVTFEDITGRVQAEAELRQRNLELNRLYNLSASLVSGDIVDLPGACKPILEVMQKEFSGSNCSVFAFDDGTRQVLAIAVVGPYAERGMKRKLYVDGPGLVVQALRTGQVVNAPDVRDEPNYAPFWPKARSELCLPLKIGKRVVGVLDLQSPQPGAFSQADVRLLTIFAEQAALALEQARLYQAEMRRIARLDALARLSAQLASFHSQPEVLETLVSHAATLSESPTAAILLLENQAKAATLAAQAGLPGSLLVGERFPLSLPILQKAVEKAETVIVPDIDRDAPELRVFFPHPDVQAFYAYPMLKDGWLNGYILLSGWSPHTPSAEEHGAYELLAKLASVALESASLFEQTNRRLEQLASLHAIDRMISSSLDISVTLGMVAEQVISQLKVDAVNILLYNPKTLNLQFVCAKGFRTPALQHTRLRLGDGYAGQVALERRRIFIPDLMKELGALQKSVDLGKERFVALVSTPLIAKGEVKGVLEIFHRRPLDPPAEWFDFLEILAGQAAIAIDSIELFEGLQRSNLELAIAYDATIEGWSAALDLRDRETEGHSQRVSDMTIQLASLMGVPEAEMTHIRRGALLHDIGKMGVPDSILLKPGPLSDEEWQVMRQHPSYAYNMLSPIDFLRPALDIPYCHHEKWDGSGYPRALKGEQIPLSARIFAVVDVWDALNSDRPYRPAWSREKAREYIQAQAGSHFDPLVVKAFLESDISNT